MGAKICVYCGQPATARDHHLLPSCWDIKRRYQPGRTVPACTTCNSTLGTMVLPGVADRAAYLSARVAVRYRKLLAMPEWTDDDLTALGPNLRSTTVNALAAKAVIVERLVRLKAAAGLTPALQPNQPAT